MTNRTFPPFRAPTVDADRMPLDVLMNRICTDLYIVFRGNGYKDIGFTLIAQSLDDQQSAASGNLKPDGIKALLESILEEMNKVEVPPEMKPN